jgi:hypothetical protein
MWNVVSVSAFRLAILLLFVFASPAFASSVDGGLQAMTHLIENGGVAADLLPGPIQAPSQPKPVRFNCCSPVCTRSFTSPGNRKRHYNVTLHDQDDDADVPPEPVAKKGRRSYTMRFKRDTLLALDALIIDKPNIACHQQWLCKKEGLPTGTVSKWNAKRADIFRLARLNGGANTRQVCQTVGAFPMAETLLYGRFIYTRHALRQRVGHAWLQENMRDLVKRVNPDERAPEQISRFNAENGWVSGYCKRWKISSQARTNKHQVPLEKRLPGIKKFHRFLIYDMQNRQPPRDPKYGRFPPVRMFHLDQVPLPFATSSQKSMNPIGDKCEVKQPGGSSASKRMCTLQVCICAQPDAQCVKIEIYFRGKGVRLQKEELDYYKTLDNVVVRFNQKAWSNEATALNTLIEFREQTLHLGEVLLGMDGHAAQITPYMRGFMDLMGIRYAITTANCTDIISPVDRHVGETIKKKIHGFYKEALKTNSRMWELPGKDGGLTDTKRRILVATWTSEAWKQFCAENHTVIKESFVQTGFLLARDGSDRLSVRPYKCNKTKDSHGNKIDKHHFTNISPDGLPYDFGPPPSDM